MMKRAKIIIALLLMTALLCPLCLPASAAHVSGGEAIEILTELGLVSGTENGFEPERAPTRSEAAVMLLRLLGKEGEAKAWTGACPFTDGGWAAKYLGYAKANGLVAGESAHYFGSSRLAGARDFITMVLRALGYSDAAGDFTWKESIAFADSIGLTHGEYTADGEFLREDLALVSYTALTLRMKDSDRTLLEQLYLSGAVSGAALKKTRLAGVTNTGKTVYSASEIWERSASAVFLAELYMEKDNVEKAEFSGYGSGFFVSPDGIAVLTFHELDDRTFLYAVTADGRRFPVTEVLFYDYYYDIAVIRVSRTDSEGNTVRFFPYLDLGDSDAVFNGETVFAIGNPLGLRYTISDGIVENRSLNSDDPAYPVLQYSAACSTGSSGGPLLNEYGEVIGVVFASYPNGQNLNLAVPVNTIANVSYTAEGEGLAEVREKVNALKDAATLSVAETDITLEVGETKKVMILFDYPGSPTIVREELNPEVATALWGSFETKQSVGFLITGESEGTAEFKIFYSNGFASDDESFTFAVKVIEKEEENE